MFWIRCWVQLLTKNWFYSLALYSLQSTLKAFCLKWSTQQRWSGRASLSSEEWSDYSKASKLVSGRARERSQVLAPSIRVTWPCRLLYVHLGPSLDLKHTLFPSLRGKYKPAWSMISLNCDGMFQSHRCECTQVLKVTTEVYFSTCIQTMAR